MQQSSGAGIKLFNVRATRLPPLSNMYKVPKNKPEALDVFQTITGEPNSVIIKENCVFEFSKGYGIVLDHSTGFISHSMLKGNGSGGILITSTGCKTYIENDGAFDLGEKNINYA
jgi:hypothetical protein